MNGTKAVAKYVSTSSHGGMVAVVSNDYSGTYVKYDDYAALLRERDALREALAECLEMADNWPGIAYSADLEQRARALLTAAAEGDQS